MELQVVSGWLGAEFIKILNTKLNEQVNPCVKSFCFVSLEIIANNKSQVFLLYCQQTGEPVCYKIPSLFLPIERVHPFDKSLFVLSTYKFVAHTTDGIKAHTTEGFTLQLQGVQAKNLFIS